MLQGRSLGELAAEIERQSKARRDFKAPESALEVVPSNGGVALKVGDIGQFPVRPVAHGQIAERLAIPKRYYDRMLEEAPALLASNANHWLAKSQDKRLVRVLDGEARGYLGDAYRPFDNDVYAGASLPVLAEFGVEIKSCEITERRLYIHAVLPRLQGEVKKGDVVQAGVLLTNSEIGLGSYKVEGWLWRLWCLNGMVTGDAFRRSHIGRRSGELTEASEVYASDTKAAEDRAIGLKIRDTVRHFLSEGYFELALKPLREAAQQRIEGHPEVVVEELRSAIDLTQAESGGVLRHLIEGGDLSRWGLANAVTRLAHDTDSYDRAVELERAGSRVIELPQTEWARISSAQK